MKLPNLHLGCKKVDGKACSRQFSMEYVTSVRASCLELSHGELDMAIMGQLVAGMNTSPTVSVVARHKEVDREKMYAALFHQGKPVCLRMFQFLHAVGKKRLRNLMGNVKENGLSPRVHGHTKRKPKHAYLFLQLSMLCGSCTHTLRSTPCFCRGKFQSTPAQIFRFFHQV